MKPGSTLFWEGGETGNACIASLVICREVSTGRKPHASALLVDGYLSLEQRNLGFTGGMQLLGCHLCDIVQQSLVDLQAQQARRQTSLSCSACVQHACTPCLHSRLDSPVWYTLIGSAGCI